MELKSNSNNIISSVRNYFREIDIPLFATVVAISLFSILNIYGISGFKPPFFGKQIMFVIIGISAMTAFSFFNYRYFKNYSLPILVFYVLSVFLLTIPFLSRTIRGINAWIILGGFTFEPAELMKIILIILMAKYFSQRHVHINDVKNIIISGIYFLVPVTIILLQPDLGSAIIISLLWLGILFVAGINKKYLFLILILAIIAGYLGWLFVLKPYQKDRIVSFLNPYSDPRGTGYNLIQSKIAIGSGFWFGNGLGNGHQAQLGFLPEPHNDFIFAATADQFGFVGIGLILAAIMFIISRILYIGRRSVSNFGKLFCVGVAILIFTHLFIGAGVNLGLMPVTGIPFPFLSYGGSHFISLMIGLGIVQSIKRYG